MREEGHLQPFHTQRMLLFAALHVARLHCTLYERCVLSVTHGQRSFHLGPTGRASDQVSHDSTHH